MYALTLIIIILLVLLTLKVPKKKVKTDRELNRECANFSKAQQKGRRQGHMLFYFHGEYYQTGLLTINGGK